MYNVSEYYMSALKGLWHNTPLKGTVDSKLITEDNILKGSLSILKQCSEGSEVKIGSVYISQLKATLLNVNVLRNSWDGVEIYLEEGLEEIVDEESEIEYVPLGKFYVGDAVYTSKGIQVTAYDNMAKFDKTFPANSMQGTAWGILSILCTDCGVQCGMTQADIEAMPNGSLNLSMYGENDVQTYRDVLSWLAQTLAAFAYIDRSGKLCLKQYGSTVVDSWGLNNRYNSAKFSDFVTRYTGISVVDIETQTTNYESVTPDDGLTYNLGSNPFMQLGTKTVKKDRLLAILNSMQNIQYTPFEAEWSTGAVYDLGDVIEFPGGRGDGAVGCIMSINWVYRGKTTIKGFGSNPALANAKGKTDKDIAGLLSQTDQNGIQYYTYMNADEIDIADGNIRSIAALRFTTMMTTKVTFQAEILIDAETDDEVECTVIYQMDGSELRYQPVETWRDGKHILSLWYVIEVEPNTMFRWQVYLEASGGSLHIDEECSRAAVWGQGLVSVKTWDGNIDIEDEISLIDITRRIGFINFTDDLEVWTDIPYTADGEETVGLIDITRRIDFIEFEDYVLVDKESLYFDGYTWGDIDELQWAEVEERFTW